MSATAGANVVRLAPSGLTFMWTECQRCYWLAARGILKRPSGPFPHVFTTIDTLTKDFFFGKRTEEMAEGLKPGRVAVGDRWVRSRPIQVPGHETRVAIAGKIDTALAFDDGSHAIVDLRPAHRRPSTSTSTLVSSTRTPSRLRTQRRVRLSCRRSARSVCSAWSRWRWWPGRRCCSQG